MAAAAAASAEPARMSMEAADALHAAGDAEGALRMVEALTAGAPEDAALLYRRSRWTAGALPAGSAERAPLVERAIADARRAVALAPDTVPPHKALAVALGKKTGLVGNGERIALCVAAARLA